jgi:HSP20 family protein
MRSFLPSIKRHDWIARPDRDYFDRFFDDFWPTLLSTEETAWVPVFDMSETDSELVVKVEVPGMDSKDINLALSDGCLTISGEKKHEKEEGDENYHRT